MMLRLIFFVVIITSSFILQKITKRIINISRKLALFKFFIIFLLTYPKITKYIRKSSYNISIHVKINSGKADFYLI